MAYKYLIKYLPEGIAKHIINISEDWRKKHQNGYAHVLSSIQRNFTPVCGGENCKYQIKKGTGLYRTYLLRSTHATCEVDGCGDGLSSYNHHVCIKHANIYALREYIYFHSDCFPEWERRKWAIEIQQLRDEQWNMIDLI